jgi:hypothetical protein
MTAMYVEQREHYNSKKFAGFYSSRSKYMDTARLGNLVERHELQGCWG